MKSFAVLSVLGLALGFGLSGCQTVEQSQQSAQITCQNQGLAPGSSAYNRCVGATYNQNRANADAANNAVAAGAAAGLVGGALVGAAAAGPYYGGYGYGYGYHPYGWGYGYGYRRCAYYGCY
jgi:hypothetical protein